MDLVKFCLPIDVSDTRLEVFTTMKIQVALCWVVTLT